VARENEAAKQKSEQVIQKPDDAEQSSREQMQRNLQGLAHDGFLCGTSAENLPIVSFDNGNFWWKDDGRCATREQAGRDQDARLSSYWPTKVRVDTDMNASWLADEERSCITTPDEKGRVSVVVCDAKSRDTHNIPVTFWGGVDRNTVSDWKCRREKSILSDTFVCRAVD
jgi:hypothetical protein